MLSRLFTRAVLELSSWVVLLCFLAAAAAAPAPLPKPAKPPELLPFPAPAHVGGWHMHWGNETGSAVFRKDHGYEAHGWGGRWVGTWKLDGDGRLTVTEGRVEGADGVPVGMWSWTVDLDGSGVAEVLPGKHGFRLEK